MAPSAGDPQERQASQRSGLPARKAAPGDQGWPQASGSAPEAAGRWSRRREAQARSGAFAESDPGRASPQLSAPQARWGLEYLFLTQRRREQAQGQGAACPIQAMTPYEQRHQNDLNGLHWVHKFGWLGSHHLGQLLWPGNASARHQADRLARSWLRRRLVIARALPERNGRALMLSTAGARLLAAHGIPAACGKDIGETAGSAWTPPATWRHDQLAAGVLVALYQQGFDVLPEHYLRRTAGSAVKLPDGLAVKGDMVVWLETESARKSGPAMRHQAEAICAVAEGSAQRVMGLRPTHAMVAFAEEQRDERGHALDHRTRVSRAVAASARRAVPLMWACSTGSRVNARVVRFTEELIEADRAAPILRRLEAGGWRPETGVLVSAYGTRQAFVWEDGDTECWAWQVDDLPGGRASTLRDAKRCCAEQLAALAESA